MASENEVVIVPPGPPRRPYLLIGMAAAFVGIPVFCIGVNVSASCASSASGCSTAAPIYGTLMILGGFLMVVGIALMLRTARPPVPVVIRRPKGSGPSAKVER